MTQVRNSHFNRKDDKDMAYVKNKNGFEIGDWATTIKKG